MRSQRVPMSPLRRTALLVGVLFVITCITAIAAKFWFYPPLLDDAGYNIGSGGDSRDWSMAPGSASQEPLSSLVSSNQAPRGRTSPASRVLLGARLRHLPDRQGVQALSCHCRDRARSMTAVDSVTRTQGDFTRQRREAYCWTAPPSTPGRTREEFFALAHAHAEGLGVPPQLDPSSFHHLDTSIGSFTRAVRGGRPAR